MLKSGGDKYIAKTNYLNLPILAKFYVLDQLAFNIGIQPGVLLSGKDKVKENGEETAFTTTNNYKSFDFAFPVGVSYEFSIIDSGRPLQHRCGEHLRRRRRESS